MKAYPAVPPFGTRAQGPRPSHACEELERSLREGLIELEMLPCDEEGAAVRFYAILDDLRTALDRAESITV